MLDAAGIEARVNGLTASWSTCDDEYEEKFRKYRPNYVNSSVNILVIVNARWTRWAFEISDMSRPVASEVATVIIDGV